MGERDARLVFSTAVEGLYHRALGGRVVPAMHEELKAIGIDLGRPLLPAYPLEVWAESLRVASRHLYPELSIDDATTELGRLAMQGVADTVMGRAIIPMIRLLGPLRMLKRMTRTMASSTNYVETKLVDEKANSASIWFNIVAEAGFYRGLLETGLKFAGAKEAEVQFASRDGDGFIYTMRWS